VSYVAKRIKLLDLDPEVINAILHSKLTSSAAEELTSVKNRDTQSQLTHLISQRHLSHRDIRRLVKENHNNGDTKYHEGRDDDNKVVMMII
jgi:ParB-like chromosome segregation protein Spo0J